MKTKVICILFLLLVVSMKTGIASEPDLLIGSHSLAGQVWIGDEPAKDIPTWQSCESSLNDVIYQFGPCQLVFGQSSPDGEMPEYGNALVWCPEGTIEVPYFYTPPVITVVINGHTYSFVAWGKWLKSLVN